MQHPFSRVKTNASALLQLLQIAEQIGDLMNTLPPLRQHFM
jgi:hypothetical protein